MFKKNILFVIGAGGSAEFDLPVGYKLSDMIAEKSHMVLPRYGRDFVGDHDLWECLRRKYEDLETLQNKINALNEIHHGIFLSSSIDNFLDKHNFDPNIVEMGKLQIAANLSKCERNSNIYFNLDNSQAKLDLKKTEKTWIDSFSRILMEGVGRNEISGLFDGISIICFNYDRCIEYYLIEAIRQSYVGVEYQEAYDVVSGLEIIHPYGSLGKLPAQLQGGHQGQVRFGHNLSDGLQPWPIIERLKTFTERIDDYGMINTLRATVNRSEVIVFLGFAFHPQNMQLLKIGEGENINLPKNVYSTGKGIALQEYNQIKYDISKLFHDTTTTDFPIDILHQGTCSELFDVHRRNLAAS